MGLQKFIQILSGCKWKEEKEGRRERGKEGKREGAREGGWLM